jgi:UBX domain-containing protein 1/4
MASADKEDQKKNEVGLPSSLPPPYFRFPFQPFPFLMFSHHFQAIRRKATTETADAKEELQRKEQIKEAARKRQDKLDDIEAKKRAKAAIEADKEARRKKAEADKAAREGRAPPSSAPAAAAAAAAPAAERAAVNHSEARLRLQTASGNILKTFPAETTLFEVAQAVEAETGTPVECFSTTFPRKKYEGSVDFSKTLKEAGMTPSSVLLVNKVG